MKAFYDYIWANPLIDTDWLKGEVTRMAEARGCKHNGKFHYKLLLFIHLLYCSRANSSCDENAFTPLTNAILEYWISENSLSTVKDYLLKLGIIECDYRKLFGNPNIPSKSYGYRFSRRYAGSFAVRLRTKVFRKHRNFAGIESDDKTPIIFKSKEEWNQKQYKAPVHKAHFVVANEQHAYLKDCIASVTINKCMADNKLNEMKVMDEKKYNRNAIQVANIENGAWRMCPNDSSDRVNSNITAMSKELRECLLIDGVKPVEVDISNCSFLFLSTFYLEDSEEKRRYIQAVEEGIFYEVIENEMIMTCSPWLLWKIEKNIGNDEIRTRIKRALITVVSASIPQISQYIGKDDDNTRNCLRDVNRAFCNLFPALSRQIIREKGVKGRRIAIELQQLEADIVINHLTVMCRDAGIKLQTIHDGVLCKPEDCVKIKEMIIALCQKQHDLTPMLKIKMDAVSSPTEERDDAEECNKIVLVNNRAKEEGTYLLQLLDKNKERAFNTYHKAPEQIEAEEEAADARLKAEEEEENERYRESHLPNYMRGLD